jgi:hypothetical protein
MILQAGRKNFALNQVKMVAHTAQGFSAEKFTTGFAVDLPETVGRLPAACQKRFRAAS